MGTVAAGAYFTGSLALRWMMLPLIVLVALRSGLRNTGVAMLLVTAVAEVAVSTGYGLSDGLTRAAALDALQGYLTVTLLCAVLLTVETTVGTGCSGRWSPPSWSAWRRTWCAAATSR